MVNRDSFTLKGILVTGGYSSSALSTEGSSVNVAGMKWFPNKDLLALDIGELNFAKKQRIKNHVQHQNMISSKLTTRNCFSKVAKIFDLTWNIIPITAVIKMNLNTLVKTGLSLDDVRPDNLR